MVTIIDVAKHAGVSVSTVSYAFSGKRAISEATRERISRSVAKLGYRPNASARALASKRVRILALVVPLRSDNNVPVMMQFVAAVATAARELEHDLLLITDEEGDAGVERLGRTALVDGVIVMDVQTNDARLPMLRALDMPSVLIGRPDEMAGLSCVDLDFREAGSGLVDHLANRGHQAIGMLGSPAAVYARHSTYALHIQEGFAAAVARRKLRSAFVPMEQNFDGVTTALEALFEAQPDTTALVVHNEGSLATVLSVLERRGLRVPQDVSVVAFCPNDMATAQQVPLTNVAVPAEDLGRAAVAMVMDLLDNRSAAGTRLFAPTLTERKSVAPPRERSPLLSRQPVDG